MQGEPWGKNQSAFYNPNPVLDFKKHSCTSYCPQKKTHTHNLKERKTSCPRKLLNPSLKNNKGPPLHVRDYSSLGCDVPNVSLFQLIKQYIQSYMPE